MHELVRMNELNHNIRENYIHEETNRCVVTTQEFVTIKHIAYSVLPLVVFFREKVNNCIYSCNASQPSKRKTTKNGI